MPGGGTYESMASVDRSGSFRFEIAYSQVALSGRYLTGSYGASRPGAMPDVTYRGSAGCQGSVCRWHWAIVFPRLAAWLPHLNVDHLSDSRWRRGKPGARNPEILGGGRDAGLSMIHFSSDQSRVLNFPGGADFTWLKKFLWEKDSTFKADVAIGGIYKASDTGVNRLTRKLNGFILQECRRTSTGHDNRRENGLGFIDISQQPVETLNLQQ